MMEKIRKIYNGDCLDCMQAIADSSVDMILTDLPYGVSNCPWDSVIPLGPLWGQYKRVIKHNGAIVLTATQPFTSILVTSNLKMFKYDWCWKKPKGTGHLNSKKQPLRDKEDILVFYNAQPIYNPQFEKGSPYTCSKSGRDTRISEKGETVYGRFMNGRAFRNDNPGIRYPKQVISFGVVGRGTLHPTQKPVPLFEYLIKTYTQEGDVVLDSCAGSFTTALACDNIGRQWICIEKEEKYCNIGRERIEENLNRLGGTWK